MQGIVPGGIRGCKDRPTRKPVQHFTPAASHATVSLICPLIGDKNFGADLCTQRRARHVSGACDQPTPDMHPAAYFVYGEAMFGLNTPLVSQPVSGLHSAGLEGASRAAGAGAFAGVPRCTLSH